MCLFCSLIGGSYFCAFVQPVLELKVEFASKPWLPFVLEIENKAIAELTDIAKISPFIELRLQLAIVNCETIVIRRYNVNTYLRLI